MNTKIHNKISHNKYIFNKLKSFAMREVNEQKKVEKLKGCVSWAIGFHTGLFSDSEIEKCLIDISQQHIFKKSSVKKKSYLHVMTKCKEYGGHTRVADEWIKATTDIEETHSLFLIDQRNENIPDWFNESIHSKRGVVYFPNSKNDISKSLELRDIASSFEKIILHVDMNDVVPILAFGTSEFDRPIIFFNHADHIFWLGVSIIDYIADLSKEGRSLTIQNRGNINGGILPIPLKFNDIKKSKYNVKRELGIDNNVKVVVTMASSYKFDKSFSNFATEVTHENKNTIFIVIGADKRETIWKDAFKESKGKVIITGILSKDSVANYKAIADIYVDSFPFNSYTSYLEFAFMGIPSFSLKTPISTLDVVKEKNMLLTTKQDLKKNIEYILNNDKYEAKYSLRNLISQYHSVNAGWAIKKMELLGRAPIKHQINYQFSKKNDITEYDEYIYVVQLKTTTFYSFFLPLTYNKMYILGYLLYIHPKFIFKLVDKTVSFLLKKV